MNRRGRTPKPILERFWAHVRKTETCWLWIGTQPKHYGQLKEKGVGVRAHRFSYELHVGPIPSGFEIDHVCRNRSCVNPAHLRLATRKQNGENRPSQVSASGVRGVHRSRRGWVAAVRHNYRLYYGGDFPTIEDANAAAIALRNRLYTHNVEPTLGVGNA